MTTPTVPRPAVFLDRDGVLNMPEVRNGRPHPPATAEEFRLLPGAVDACEQLRADGYALVVVTNQPDVARGTQALEEIERMHDILQASVKIDAIYMCLHDNSDNCDCRKPEPGLIFQAASELDLDLSRSFLVGDRWRDIDAARRANVRAVHVNWHYDERIPVGADVTVSSLREAAIWIHEIQEGR